MSRRDTTRWPAAAPARRTGTGLPAAAGAARLTGLAASAAVRLIAAVAIAGCATGVVSATPPIVPGRTGAPREVNLIARDYAFVPSTLDLVPGETILLHVIDAGLETHEAVIGNAAVQAAWETAEAATAGAPPGPTPLVQVPADVAGVRIVVQSGERVDLAWTVPADAAKESNADGDWLVGCHIPGHWAKGMQIPIRWVTGSTP
jgi:uncharacterized cupredoxin-like copper-binding protein